MTQFNEYAFQASSKRALEAMDIHTPTPIQAETIPHLLDGRDVIGQAYTGSGKTLAFALPMVEQVDPDARTVQALVLCPTRELAQQVGGVVADLTRDNKVQTTIVFGGRAIGPQQDAIRGGAQIIIGTPGRILDLLNRGSLKLNNVRFLVLDEADQMLDRGFAPDVERILSQTSPDRQTALFSATTPDWVHRVSSKYLKNPAFVEIKAENGEGPDIDHVVYEIWGGSKFDVLRKLLDEPAEGTTLVFGRTKYGVRNLAAKLRRLGYDAGELQGNLNQQQRDRVLNKFRAGHMPILVATNVAARGLDVLHIGRVINYELPETHELFTHRVGRTGRMGRSGRAITLLGAGDLPKWHEIERGLGRKLPRINPDGEEVKKEAVVPVNSRNGRGRRKSYALGSARVRR